MRLALQVGAPDHHLDRKLAPVGVHRDHLGAAPQRLRRAAFAQRADRRLVAGAVARQHDGLHHRAAQHFGAAAPEHRLGGGVELDDAALRIGRDDGRQRVVDDRRLERLGTLLGGLRLARRIEGVARQQRPGRPAGRQHRLARRRVERLAVQVVDQAQRGPRVAPPEDRRRAEKDQQQRRAAGGVGPDVAPHQAADVRLVARVDGAPGRDARAARRQQHGAAAQRDRRRGGFAQRVVGDARQRAVEHRVAGLVAPLVVPHHGAVGVEHPEAADGRVDARRLQRRHRQLAGQVAAPLEQVERGGGGDRAVGAHAPGHRVTEHQALGAAAPLASQQALQRLGHAGGLQLGEQRRAVDPGVDPGLRAFGIDVDHAPEAAAAAADQARLLREHRGLLDARVAPGRIAAPRAGQQHLRRAVAQHGRQRVQRPGRAVGGGRERCAVDRHRRRDGRLDGGVAQAQQVVAQRREHGVQPRDAAVGAHRDLPLRAERDDLELQHQHVDHRRQHRRSEQQHQQRIAAAQAAQRRFRHRLRQRHEPPGT